tara:strand:- start:80 stop:187 length:108 start_codon:yes stop_codon:yes gene_type:complete
VKKENLTKEELAWFAECAELAGMTLDEWLLVKDEI